MSHSLAKNTSFMTLASIGQKILAFAYFTLIARMIGVENTGKYFFALSFTTVFVVFIDLGLTNVFIREASKTKERLQEYFSVVLAVKLGLAVVTYIAAVLTINLLGYPIDTRQLVYLSAVTMVFDTLHMTLYGVLRALGNLKYEAFGIVGTQFLTLVLGTAFLFLGLPVIFLILAFTIPSACNVLFVSLILIKKYGMHVRPKWDKLTFKYLGRIVIPFAIAAVFARIYSYADTMILSQMMGEIAVGWYSIPYKITYAFQFIPLALVAALYPKFSEYYIADREKLASVFEYGMKYLFLVAFPIAVGIGVLAKDIILFLYTPEYLPSVVPLQILIIGLIFSYASFPVGAFLNACNRQISQTVIVGIVMVVNIVLNLLLIPVSGVTGAAISALVGNILLTILGLCIIPRIAENFSFKSLLSNFIRIGLSAGIMGIAVVWLNGYMHFLYTIPLGAGVYGICLFILKVLDIQKIKDALILIRR
ncbi:MAG: flippase [Candidatus Magasanikbacteria bacterium]